MTRLSARAAAAQLALVAMTFAAQAQAPASSAPTAEQRSTLADQQAIALTIYNDDLALVKDSRQLMLPRGVSRLALRDVSARMRPETAQLRSLSQPSALSVLEQNFDFDLLTPAKLLEKSVGKTVRVIKTHPQTGAETVETAEVLSANQGVVLKIGDRIETGMPGRLVFDGVPALLRDRPTLVTELESQLAGKQSTELSYLTGGLSWHADYVAELGADDRTLDLNGWITLTNQSGTAYPNAQVQLVAGDVNRVKEDMDMRMARGRLMMAEAPALAASKVAQEALFEYHLYTLGRATTLAESQTKQVALMNANGVPATKELLFNGADYYYHDSVGELGRKLKAQVFVAFANREADHLGQPLPKGVVRVYKRDSAGHAQFVGEDRIDHTPKNETLRLHLGEAFDVTADKKQTDFKRREPGNQASYVTESAYEIVLKNAKPEPVTVTVREPVPGDWKMLESSAPHEKAAAGVAQWRIRLPAEGSTTLKYRVLTRF